MSPRTRQERDRSPLAFAKPGRGYLVAQVATYSLVPALLILMMAEPGHHLAKGALAVMASLINAILN